MRVRRLMLAVVSAACLVSVGSAAPAVFSAAQPGDTNGSGVIAAPASAPRPGTLSASDKSGMRHLSMSPPSQNSGPAYAPHAVLVQLAHDTIADRERIKRTVHGSRVEAVVDGVVKITVAGPAAEAVKTLQGDPAVALATLDRVRHKDSTPNDPFYGTDQKYLATVRMPQAWDLQRSGAGAIVAVVDTGVDATHPDLTGKVVAGYNAVTDTSATTDYDGHGTMVAGIIAANTNNSKGVAGVTWNGRIMPITVYDRGSDSAYDSDIARGIDWAVAHGAKIVNLSLSGPDDDPVLHTAIQKAVATGVLVFASAGNTGANDIRYPAWYPEVVTVGATDATGALTHFSSWGEHVDVAAPGFAIATTYSRYATCGWSCTYVIGDGTSFSTPMVAGVAALLKTKTPSLTAAQIVARLKSTARDAGPRGIDPYYGSGVVDAYRALGGPATADFPLRAGGSGEPNDVPARATPLGATATGTIAIEGDVDWYRFTLTQPTNVWIRVHPAGYGPDRPFNFDPVIGLYDPRLGLIAQADTPNSPGAPEIVSADVGKGTFYLKVRSANGSADPRTYDIIFDKKAGPPFMDPVMQDIGSWPRMVAIGDVTGDGRNDVVADTDYYFDPDNDYKVFVWAQQPDGTLAPPVRYSLPPSTGAGPLVLADLNHDGRTDVADGVHVFYQNTAGTLDPVTALSDPLGASYAAGGDFNGDGRTDLAVSGNGGLIVLTQKLDGTFDHTTTPALGGQIRTGDVDGDGRDEILMRLTVYDLADGVWHPTTLTAPDVTGNLNALALGDISGDGKLDAAFCGDPTNVLDVLVGHGDGTFATARGYDLAGRCSALTVADWNGDGRNDVIFGGGVLPQQSDGTLGANIAGLGTPEKSTAVAASGSIVGAGITAGDIDGDHLADMVAADQNGILFFYNINTAVNRPREWVKSTSVAANATSVPRTLAPLTITMNRPLDPATVNGQTVRLVDGRSGTTISAVVRYSSTTKTITVQRFASLGGRQKKLFLADHGVRYRLYLGGIKDTSGDLFDGYWFNFVG